MARDRYRTLYASRVALEWEDEAGARETWTYRRIQDEADRFSNVLRALGVSRGERVALILPQRPETIVAYVRDIKRNEVTVMSGTGEVTYRDPVLVKRLVKAAPASGQARK